MPEPDAPQPPQVPPPAAPRPPLPVPPAPPPSPRIQKPPIDQLLKLWGAERFDGTQSPGATIKIVRETATTLKAPSKLPDRVFSLTFQPKASKADYLIDEPLGEGGMGVVYSATQRCLNRPVAVKTIKPEAATNDSSQKLFLSEALITGKLDHPNVVPVHELGANGEGLLFYSMKQIRGTPWGRVIRDKTLDENLEILLRVADAIAFAHANDILHCDLKPDNVMLGEYGEVYVLDWGLALSTQDVVDACASGTTTVLGGTPAYMPPEFANGEPHKTGPASDIYLLGAVLYEILTGRPPHTAASFSKVIASASSNTIAPIFSHAELAGIALKCLATEPSGRYATVQDLQREIRGFRTHLDSLMLADTAHYGLQQAEASSDYGDYSRALHGFEQALKLWDANPAAQSGLAEARLKYASRALSRTDLDLAESLLERENPAHHSLLRTLDAKRRERDHRQAIMRRMKQGMAALIVGIIATLSIAQFWIRSQRNAAREEAFIHGTRLAEQRLMDGDWQEVRSIRGHLPSMASGWEWEWLEHHSHIRLDPVNSGMGAVREARFSQNGQIRVLLRDNRLFEILSNGLSRNWRASFATMDFQVLGTPNAPEILAWEGTSLVHLDAEGRELSRLRLAEVPTPGTLGPSGKTVLLMPPDGAASVHETGTGKRIVVLEPVPGLRAAGGCLSPDDQRAALFTLPSRQILIHDARTGKIVIQGPERHEAGKDPPDRLRYLPDGSALLVCGFGKGIAAHDPDTLTPRLALPLPTAPAGFAASPDARLLAGGSEHGDLHILDLSRDRLLWRLKIGDRPLATLFFDPDSLAIHAADADGNLYSIPLHTRDPWQTLRQDRFPILRLLPDLQNRSLYAAGQDGTLWRLPVDPGKDPSPPEYLAHSLYPRCGLGLTKEPGGRYLVYGTDQGLVAHDLKSGTSAPWVPHSRPRHLAASPDGKHLAVLALDRRLEVYETQTRSLVFSLALGEVPHNELEWLPDSSRLAVSSTEGTILIYDPSEPSNPASLRHQGAVTTLSASPDGRQLAAASSERILRVWDLKTLRLVSERSGFEDILLDLAYSPDRQRLLCTGADGKIHVLDTRSFRTIVSFQAHRGAAVQGALSPGGSTLFTSGTDGSVRLWPGTRTQAEWKP